MSKYTGKLQFEDDDNVAVEAAQKGKNTVNTAVIMQRQKIKRQYAKAARNAKKNGKSMKNSAAQTKKGTEKVAAAVSKHPVIFAVLGGLLLIIIILTSTVSSCSNVAITAITAVLSSSYVANTLI